MKPKYIFILFALIPSTFSFSQTTDYEWDWGIRGGGPRALVSRPSSPPYFYESQRVRDIAIDTLNNYYFLADIGGGRMSTEPSFGNIPNDTIHIPTYNDPLGTSNYNSRDSYLVSTTCEGEFRWQKTIGYGADVGAYNVKTDALGGVYVVGSFALPHDVQTPVHYDQDSIRNGVVKNGTYSNNNKSAFMLKYDSSGDFQWLKEPQEEDMYFGYDKPGELISRNLHVESDGTLHWLVHLENQTLENGQVVADSTYMPKVGRYVGDLLVLKYDKDATFLGYTRLDISTNFTSVVRKNTTFEYDVAKKRYYFSIKHYLGTGGNGMAAVNGVDVVGGIALFAFDSDDGSLVWWHENTQNHGAITDMVLDEQGDLYLTGAISSNDNFAGHITPNITGGPFVIKLNSNGQLIWGTHAETPLMWSSHSIALNDEEVFIGLGLGAQNYMDGVQWDGLEYGHGAGHGSDPAVIRFNRQTGSAIKIHDILSAGYGNHDIMTAIAVDKLGNIVVGGIMLSPWLFENHPIVPRMDKKNSNVSDFFIAKLAKDGVSCDDYLSVVDVPIPTSTHLKIYPNPTDRILHWESNQAVVSYVLYDLSGRELVSDKVTGYSGSIFLKNLASGTYFLVMNTETGTRLQQHIIKK